MIERWKRKNEKGKIKTDKKWNEKVRAKNYISKNKPKIKSKHPFYSSCSHNSYLHIRVRKFLCAG